MQLGKRTLLTLMLVICLPRCASASGSQESTVLSQSSKANTKTNILQTQTEAPSPTMEWTATVTPTIGPPPDLELKSTTIYSMSDNRVGGYYSILGRIRNNTDKIMLLYYRDTIFSFIFEVWQYDSGDFSRYIHAKYSQEVSLTDGNSNRIMNCILYPGDEGVFTLRTSSTRKEYILLEELSTYNGPLGLWYTYESYNHTIAKLPENLHPKAENIKFRKEENGALIFEYDVIRVPNKINMNNYAQLYSWIVLYDNNDLIINVLFQNLVSLGGVELGEDYHVHGSVGPIDKYEEGLFRPAVHLTTEMIESVDHIEVFNEFEEEGICYSYTYE